MSSTIPPNDIVETLRWQAHWCDVLGSPLYAELLEAAAVDVLEAGPVAGVLKGHGEDPPGSALALRFMGAVHRIVLEGRAPSSRGSIRRPEVMPGSPALGRRSSPRFRTTHRNSPSR